MYKDIEYKSGVFIRLSTLFRLSGWALIKNTVWHVNGWWVGTSKEYRRKLDIDMIGMIPHYFVYKDFTAPELHDTCKRVAYDSWTGMKVTVIYESETRWGRTRLPRQWESSPPHTAPNRNYRMGFFGPLPHSQGRRIKTRQSENRFFFFF